MDLNELRLAKADVLPELLEAAAEAKERAAREAAEALNRDERYDVLSDRVRNILLAAGPEVDHHYTKQPEKPGYRGVNKRRLVGIELEKSEVDGFEVRLVAGLHTMSSWSDTEPENEGLETEMMNEHVITFDIEIDGQVVDDGVLPHSYTAKLRPGEDVLGNLGDFESSLDLIEAALASSDAS